MLLPGDPTPRFNVRSSINSNYSFADAAAGRFLVLSFLGSFSDAASRAILDRIELNRHRFDVENTCFFAVSTDPQDELLVQTRSAHPAITYFWDFDRVVSRLFGSAQDESQYRAHTLVLDPALRVVASFAVAGQPEKHVERILRFLDTLPPVRTLTGFAPVLVIPWVFEPELCRTLIDQHVQNGGQQSGFLRDVNGKTVRMIDFSLKKRFDYHLQDPAVIEAALVRLRRRLLPEIKKAFQFDVTRIERHVVVCYDGGSGGYFRQHRDDTTQATAHRRFAVTLNLNSGDYEGGDLRFPEFGPRTYRAPTGGAIVFSCSLLHEALPVSRGRRYAYVPFLFDEAGEELRLRGQQNHIGGIGSPE